MLQIWEMLCYIEMRETSHPVGKRARKVKDYDYEAVPMQIGFLYYLEWHNFPRRAYFFLILQGCFPLCAIYYFVYRELFLSAVPVSLFGLERDFIFVQSGYRHFRVK